MKRWVFVLLLAAVAATAAIRTRGFSHSIDSWNYENRKLSLSQNRLIETPLSQISRLNPYSQEPWGLGYGVSQFDRFFFLGKVLRRPLSLDARLYLDYAFLALSFGLLAVVLGWGAGAALTGFAVALIGNSGHMLGYSFHNSYFAGVFLFLAGLFAWKDQRRSLSWTLTLGAVLLLAQTKAELIVFATAYLVWMAVSVTREWREHLFKVALPSAAMVLVVSFEKLTQMLWVVRTSARSPHFPGELHSFFQLILVAGLSVAYFTPLLFIVCLTGLLVWISSKPKTWARGLLLIPCVGLVLLRPILGDQNFAVGWDFFRQPRLGHFALLDFFKTVTPAGFAFLIMTVPAFWIGLWLDLKTTRRRHSLKSALLFSALMGTVLFCFLEPDGFRILYWPLNPVDHRWWALSLALILVVLGLSRVCRETDLLSRFSVLGLAFLFVAYFFVNPLLLPFGVYFQPDRQSFLLDVHLSILAVLGLERLRPQGTPLRHAIAVAGAFFLFHLIPMFYEDVHFERVTEEQDFSGRYKQVESALKAHEPRNPSEYRVYSDASPDLRVNLAYQISNRVFNSSDSFNRRTDTDNIWAHEAWEAEGIVFPHIWRFVRNALVDAGLSSFGQNREYFRYFEKPIPLEWKDVPEHALVLSGIAWVLSAKPSSPYAFFEKPRHVPIAGHEDLFLFRNKVAKPRVWFGYPQVLPYLPSSPERLRQIQDGLKNRRPVLVRLPEGPVPGQSWDDSVADVEIISDRVEEFRAAISSLLVPGA